MELSLDLVTNDGASRGMTSEREVGSVGRSGGTGENETGNSQGVRYTDVSTGGWSIKGQYNVSGMGERIRLAVNSGDTVL